MGKDVVIVGFDNIEDVVEIYFLLLFVGYDIVFIGV